MVKTELVLLSHYLKKRDLIEKYINWLQVKNFMNKSINGKETLNKF